MGFGLIFLGWSTLLFFKLLPVGVIGCFLMLKGLVKLEGYNKYFVYAKRACYAFSVYFVLYTVFWMLDFANLLPIEELFGFLNSPTGKTFNAIDGALYNTLLCVFSYFLYKALGEISALVGFEKGVKREQRATAMLIVFVLFTCVRLVLNPFGLAGYLTMPLVVLELVLILYMGMYIYSCYMMIATQEIIDDENKKMREYDEKYSLRTKKNTKSK